MRKLDISDIKYQKNASKEVEESLNIGLISLRGQEIDLGILSVKGKASNVEEGILLSGEAKGTIILTCSRCLDKFKHPLKFRINEFFAFKDTEAEYRVEDNLIDLSSIIIESLALNLDIKILCKEDCAGLCPSCGINLNKEPCECKQQPVDIRWHKLQELKDKFRKE